MIKLIKKIFTAFLMAASMFTTVPMPFMHWNDDCTSLILPLFPIVGLLIGLLNYGAYYFLNLFEIHNILIAALLTIVPFFITGFIHLDGFMDTTDAILSRRSLEERIRILKDSHTGAFATIFIVILFLLIFSANYAIVDGNKDFSVLIFIPIISRAVSAYSLLSLETLKTSGYGTMFKQNTGIWHRIFIAFVAAICLVCSYLFYDYKMTLCLLTVLICSSTAMLRAYRNFLGVSGDLSGYALVIGEVCGLLMLSILG